MLRCVDYFRREGDCRGEALALASLAVAQFAQEPPDLDGMEESARRSLELAEEYDIAFGGAMAGVMIGRVRLAQGRADDAVRRFETSLTFARGIGDTLGQAIALSHLGWAHLLAGEPHRARECFGEQLLLASTIGHEEGIADALEGMFAVATTSGDVERAGRMLGAAEDIRARKGLPIRSPLSFFEPFLERVLAGPDASRFETARRLGRGAELADVVEAALA
jgi:tetratricopeptide (TPR) repeat protein